MSLSVKTIRSGSSGNCVLIQTSNSRILMDCGLGSQMACRQMLDGYFGNSKIDAILITHAHSDHINYSSLRVIEQRGIPLYIHERCLPQVIENHYQGRDFEDLHIELFASDHFQIGDLVIQPVEIPHAPSHFTCGFVVSFQKRNRWYKLVLATDLRDSLPLFEHCIDDDFIYIESNYDLKMLAQKHNYASRFHMSNPKTAELLFNVRLKSRLAPKAVMLGHLSEERNIPQLAIKTVHNTFETGELPLDFDLFAAPRYEPSHTITVA
jgi:phosphoribosyl 1,2-cyclic phosphodiesterase